MLLQRLDTVAANSTIAPRLAAVRQSAAIDRESSTTSTSALLTPDGQTRVTRGSPTTERLVGMRTRSSLGTVSRQTATATGQRRRLIKVTSLPASLYVTSSMKACINTIPRPPSASSAPRSPLLGRCVVSNPWPSSRMTNTACSVIDPHLNVDAAVGEFGLRKSFADHGDFLPGHQLLANCPASAQN